MKGEVAMRQQRYEVMMFGLGGRGVLTLGQILGSAGSKIYNYASYFTAYTYYVRGGPAECTVILSNEEIASPALDIVDTIIILDVLDQSSLKAYEERVKPNGLLIAEKSVLDTFKVARTDVKIKEVPGLKIASDLGGSLAANFVYLGVYVALTEAVPSQVIETEVHSRYSSNPKVLHLNLSAFKAGQQFITRGM
jgi:2-oxoglutarate ferredoxin oxidoreductase subunit gamma